MEPITKEYVFRGQYIPPRMLYAIEYYVKEGRIPGHFLQAIIKNDLRDAVSRADDENLKNLAAYVGYFYNETPGTCWGSEKHMLDWAKKFCKE